MSDLVLRHISKYCVLFCMLQCFNEQIYVHFVLIVVIKIDLDCRCLLFCAFVIWSKYCTLMPWFKVALDRL